MNLKKYRELIFITGIITTFLILGICTAIQLQGTSTDSPGDAQIHPSVSGIGLIRYNRTLSTSLSFNLAYGLAVNASGYIYACDASNNRIQIFSPDGIFVNAWGINGGNGSYGAGDGEFHYPCGIAINTTGAVYVADSGNYRVQILSPDGTFIKKWGLFGTGNGNFSQPEGIAINGTGHVYVGDTFNHRIQVFSPDGTFITKWGKNGGAGGSGSSGTGNGEFNLPTAIAFGSTGHVLVCDSSNMRVQEFSVAGQYISQWGGFTGTYGPSGIAVNSTGYTFVTGSGSNDIKVFYPNGTLCYTWGNATIFNFPRGIAFSGDKLMYISEYWGNRVKAFTLWSPGNDIDVPVIDGMASSLILAGLASGMVMVFFRYNKMVRRRST
jgi:tripartite motif-containing protein 71